MARYINEATLVKAIVRERDKIPLRVPCAPYELLDERPYAVGQAQRAGIRKALRCVSEAPTADVVEVVRCKDCRSYEPHGNGKAGRCRNPKCKGLHLANDFCSYGERSE